jgi:flagellar basal-body rod protein FlgB
MGVMQMPVFSALAEKMRWHQARQGVLAENVANAETPGFRGRDLAQFQFEDHLRTLSVAAVTTATTTPGHIAVGGSGAGGFNPRDTELFELTPEGNSVTLEDEMMKITTNQMDYQAATTLYTRSLKVLRTALGR